MPRISGYSWLQIALHWIIALLILFQFLFHEGIRHVWIAYIRGQSVDTSAALTHILVGSALLLLVAWRLALRVLRGVPEVSAGGGAVQEAVRVWTTRLLYVLMILIPVSGLVAWFGGIDTAGGLHGLLFNLLMALVLLHISAAAYHQWVLKDGLIGRIIKAN